MSDLLDRLEADLAAMDIPPLDRFDLYANLDLVRVMEPETEVLMQERAEAELVGDEFDSPHSRPWFVSYHGSEFPGNKTTACQRYLNYRMMNFPRTSAMPPWVTSTGVMGKAGELDIADAWFKGGRLLAIPEDGEKVAKRRVQEIMEALQHGGIEAALEAAERPGIHQLGFVDPDHWFTVSTDLPILPKGWHKPHIVEVKCKAHDVIQEMLEGRLLMRPDGTVEKVGRKADPKHEIQLKATLGEAHRYDWGEVTVCKHSWRILASELHERLGIPGGQVLGTDAFNRCPEHGYGCQHTFKLEPPTTGEVYYWSRSWPRGSMQEQGTKSYWYDLDLAFMEEGKKQLAEARQHYINDTIAPIPEHFSWSVGACKDCTFKKFCKIDAGLTGKQRKPRPENVRTVLSESAGVEHTRLTRPNYDPHAIRARVMEEWADA